MQEKVAIFIDVENLTHWIKNNGPKKLITEMNTKGQIIIRRAYAKWTNQNLQGFQAELNRQGFELIHNFHPVSGKNSSDIQMTVDVMEYALNPSDIKWFVLATGDSDFSPLFRKLREMGKHVVGVAPRSPLSECVKTSCSLFYYTDNDNEQIKHEILNSERDDAVDLLEEIMKNIDSKIVCSAVKDQMINLNSAFNEKALGFKSFTDFLRSADFIELSLDSDGSTWYASYVRTDSKHSSYQKDINQTSTDELYRRFLRKRGIRLISKELLVDIYNSIVKLSPIRKIDIVDKVLSNTQKDITSTDVKKAITIFRKAGLFSYSDPIDKNSDDKMMTLEKREDFIRLIDEALISRLLSTIEETSSACDIDAFSKILYGRYTSNQLENLLNSKNVKSSSGISHH